MTDLKRLFDQLIRWKSSILLVLANMTPLIGVFFFGWNANQLLLLYWAESAVIGFYTILKMAFAKGGTDNSRLKPFMMIFFLLHFSIFMVVHFIFLLYLFGSGLSFSYLSGIAIQLLVLFVSHGISFLTNYMGGENLKATPDGLFFEPYYRIIPMQLTIILGALIGMPILVLVAAKTIVDLLSHLNQRKEFEYKKRR